MDDMLCIGQRDEHLLLSEICNYFYIKAVSVGPSTIYLCKKVSKVNLENGIDKWSFISYLYVQAAISNVDK